MSLYTETRTADHCFASIATLISSPTDAQLPLSPRAIHFQSHPFASDYGTRYLEPTRINILRLPLVRSSQWELKRSHPWRRSRGLSSRRHQCSEQRGLLSWGFHVYVKSGDSLDIDATSINIFNQNWRRASWHYILKSRKCIELKPWFSRHSLLDIFWKMQEWILMENLKSFSVLMISRHCSSERIKKQTMHHLRNC